jgi:hypothetical protein
MPLFRLAPPWVVLAALCGLTSAAAFYLVAGRSFRSLPTYLVLGVLFAPICQVLFNDLPPLPPPLTVGEVDLVAVTAGTWLLLAIARFVRL